MLFRDPGSELAVGLPDTECVCTCLTEAAAAGEGAGQGNTVLLEARSTHTSKAAQASDCGMRIQEQGLVWGGTPSNITDIAQGPRLDHQPAHCIWGFVVKGSES